MSVKPEIKLSELEKEILRRIYDHNKQFIGKGYPIADLYSEFKEKGYNFDTIKNARWQIKNFIYTKYSDPVKVYNEYKGEYEFKPHGYLFIKREYFYLVETEEERKESEVEEKVFKETQDKRKDLILQIEKLKEEDYNQLKSENKLPPLSNKEHPFTKEDEKNFIIEAKKVYPSKKTYPIYREKVTHPFSRYIYSKYLNKLGFFEFEPIDQLVIDAIFRENRKSDWEFGITYQNLKNTVMNEGYAYRDLKQSLDFLTHDIKLIFYDLRKTVQFYYINEFCRSLFMSEEEKAELEASYNDVESTENESIDDDDDEETTLFGSEYEYEEEIFDEIFDEESKSILYTFTEEDQQQYKLETGNSKTIYNGVPTKDFAKWLEENKPQTIKEEPQEKTEKIKDEPQEKTEKRQTKIDYKKRLNEEQYAVIENLEGNKLILAGAGSGKTRTLTHAVTKLIEEGIDQRRIVLVTFTVKATQEMRERMEELLASIGLGVKGLRSGTFHALARYFITYEHRKQYNKGDEDEAEKEPNTLGWKYLKYNLVKERKASQTKDPRYTLELLSKRKAFIESIVNSTIHQKAKDEIGNRNVDDYDKELEKIKNQIRSNFPDPTLCGEIISATYNYRKTVRQVIEEIPRFKEKMDNLNIDDVELVHKTYQMRKKADNYIDYDDLIEGLWRLLDEREPQRLAQYLPYLFVDEYQDTNIVQNEIIEKWANLKDNKGNYTTKLILVVGDDAQSIYAFRGARFQNILDFKQNFRNVTVQKLVSNYRSTPEIIDLANNSIKNNTLQYSGKNIEFLKEMSPIRDPFKKPLLIQCPDHDVQIEYIINQIKQLNSEGIFHYFDGEMKSKKGIPYSEMAILCRAFRSNFDDSILYMIPTLLKELLNNNIPYKVTDFGIVEFFDKAHIKDFLSMFLFLNEPNTEFGSSNLVRIVRGYVDQVGDTTVTNLYHSWLKDEDKPFSILSDPQKLYNKIDELNQKIISDAQKGGYTPLKISIRGNLKNLTDLMNKLLIAQKEKNFGLQIEKLFTDEDINKHFLKLYYDDQDKSKIEERIKDVQMMIELAYEHPNFNSFEEKYLSERDPKKIKAGDYDRWWDSKTDKEKREHLLDVNVSLKQVESLLKKMPTWKLLSKTNSSLAKKLKNIYRTVKFEKDCELWWNELKPESKTKTIVETGIIQQKAELLTKKLSKWEDFGEKNKNLKIDLKKHYEFLLNNKVSISTIHKAKGLEWDTVFMPNLISGSFPHAKSSVKQEDLEEERRLFYVGITRAKSHLFLSYHKSNTNQDSCEPSSFLTELEPHLYTEIELDPMGKVINEVSIEKVDLENTPAELLERIIPLIVFLEKSYKEWFNIPEVKTNFDILEFYMSSIGVNSENKLLDDDLLSSKGILIELENEGIYTHLINPEDDLERKYKSISEEQMIFWDFEQKIPFHIKTEDGVVIIKKIIPEVKREAIEEKIVEENKTMEELIEEEIEEKPIETKIEGVPKISEDWNLEETLTAYGRFRSSVIYEYFLRGDEAKHVIHLTDDWTEEKIVKINEEFYDFVLIYQLFYTSATPPDVSAGRNVPHTEYFLSKEEFAQHIIERDLLDRRLTKKHGLIPYQLIWAINLKDKELFINEPPIVKEANSILEEANLFKEEERLVVKQIESLEIVEEEPLIEGIEGELSEEDITINKLKPFFQYISITQPYKDLFSLPILESRDDYKEIYKEKIGIYSENCYFPKQINESKGILIEIDNSDFYIILIPEDKDVESIYKELDQKEMLYWDFEDKKPSLLFFEKERVIKSIPITKTVSIEETPSLTPSQKLIIQIGEDLYKSFTEIQDKISENLTIGDDIEEQRIDGILKDIELSLYYEKSGIKFDSTLNFNSSKSFNNALVYFDDLSKNDPVEFNDIIVLIRNDLLMKIGTKRIYNETRNRELKRLSEYRDKDSSDYSFWFKEYDKKEKELETLSQSKYLDYSETREAQRYLSTLKNVKNHIFNEWDSLNDDEKAIIESKVNRDNSIRTAKRDDSLSRVEIEELKKVLRANVTHSFLMEKAEIEKQKQKEIETWWDGLSTSIRGEILEDEFEISLNEIEEISDYSFKELNSHYKYQNVVKDIIETYDRIKEEYSEYEEEEEYEEYEEEETSEQILMRELMERFQTSFNRDPYDVEEGDQHDIYSDLFITYLKSLGFSEERINELLEVEVELWEYAEEEEEEEEKEKEKPSSKTKDEWEIVIQEENYRVEEKGNRERHTIIFPDGQEFSGYERNINDYTSSNRTDGILIPIPNFRSFLFTRDDEWAREEDDKLSNTVLYLRDLHELKMIKNHKDYYGFGSSPLLYLDVNNRKTYKHESELIKGMTEAREQDLLSWTTISEEPEYDLLRKIGYERHIVKKDKYYREWIYLEGKARNKYIIVAIQLRNSDYKEDTIQFLEFGDDDDLLKFIDNDSPRYSSAKDYRIYFTINLIEREIIKRFDLLEKTLRKNLVKLGEIQKLVLQTVSDKSFWQEPQVRDSLKRTNSVSSMLKTLNEKGLVNKYGMEYKITEKGLYVLEALGLKIKEPYILKSDVVREEFKEKDIDIRFKFVEYKSKLIHNTEDSAKLELEQITELWNQYKTTQLELFPFDAQIIEEKGKFRVYANNTVNNINYFEANGVLPSKESEEEKIEVKEVKGILPKEKIRIVVEDKPKEKRSLNELEAKYTEIYDKKAVWGGVYTNKFKQYLHSLGYSTDEIEILLKKEEQTEQKEIKEPRETPKKTTKSISEEIISLTNSINEKKIILEKRKKDFTEIFLEILHLISDKTIKRPRRKLKRHTFQEEED